MDTKYTELLKYSNPKQVAQNAIKYFGKHVPVYISTRKNAKYMILGPDSKFVHFGLMPYKDFTKHKDTNRQYRYLQKAMNIRGRWYQNPYSPNSLAINLLWT